MDIQKPFLYSFTWEQILSENVEPQNHVLGRDLVAIYSPPTNILPILDTIFWGVTISYALFHFVQSPEHPQEEGASFPSSQMKKAGKSS